MCVCVLCMCACIYDVYHIVYSIILISLLWDTKERATYKYIKIFIGTDNSMVFIREECIGEY